MAYVHQTIKLLREAVHDLGMKQHIDYRDSYAANHLIDVLELFVYGTATTPQLERAIQDLQGALDHAMTGRTK